MQHRALLGLALVCFCVACDSPTTGHSVASPITKSTRSVASPGLAAGPTQPFVSWVYIVFLSADGRYLSNVATIADKGELRISMLDFKPGEYELIISTEGALDKSIKFKYDPAIGVSDLDFRFDFGDLNADNKITPDEVEFVRSQMGKNVATGADWFGGITSPPFPGMADIDLDDKVTEKDLAIIESNVGKVALKPKSLFEK